MALIQDEELCRIFVAGCQHPGSLSPEAGLRFATYLGQLFNTFESLYFQTQHEAVDATFLSAKVSAYRSLLAQPGIRAWWQGAQAGYDPRFRKFVQSQVEPPAV
jgi:hypothetical protein